MQGATASRASCLVVVDVSRLDEGEGLDLRMHTMTTEMQREFLGESRTSHSFFSGALA